MTARVLHLCAALIIIISTTTGCTDVIGRFRNESVSMQPSLWDGEYLFTDNLAYVNQSPQRGDIVIFNRPGGRQYIKRVVGLPGETLEIRGGKVSINSVEINESYLNGPMRVDLPARSIESDHYFVMGDNRNNSSDSRGFGTIDISDIIGRALFVYAPTERMRLIVRPKYNSN